MSYIKNLLFLKINTPCVFNEELKSTILTIYIKFVYTYILEFGAK